MDPPCKECRKREIGCHAKREEYLAYSKWCQERNERAHKARGIAEGFYDAAVRRRRKKER